MKPLVPLEPYRRRKDSLSGIPFLVRNLPSVHNPSMSEADIDLWNKKAEDWHLQVGLEGDKNRRLNSDPVLWRMAGNVSGLDVLDAGSGTGYLSIQLGKKGARVRGVDYASAMLEQARTNAKSANIDIPFALGSVAELTTIADQSIDLIISNYVLMDCADLDGAVRNFHRVLRSGGRAILVFSHPCFDIDAFEHAEGGPRLPLEILLLRGLARGRFMGPFQSPLQLLSPAAQPLLALLSQPWFHRH